MVAPRDTPVDPGPVGHVVRAGTEVGVAGRCVGGLLRSVGSRRNHHGIGLRERCE